MDIGWYTLKRIPGDAGSRRSSSIEKVAALATTLVLEVRGIEPLTF